MAKTQVILCDVMLAQGKSVPATHLGVERILPKEVSPTKKRQTLKLDLSDEGMRQLKVKDQKYERLLQEAGKIYTDLTDSRDDVLAHDPAFGGTPKDAKKDDAQEENSSEKDVADEPVEDSGESEADIESVSVAKGGYFK